MRRELPPSGALYVEMITYRMIFLVVSLWVCAIITYAEPFRLFSFAISDLGALHTPGGLPNRSGIILYSLSMLLMGGYMFKLRGHYRRFPAANDSLYGLLYLLGGIGALIACCPTDLNSFTHSIGSGLLVFSQVFIAFTRILAQRQAFSVRSTRMRTALLFIPMLLYAGLWVIRAGSGVQFFQKAAFSSLLAIELRTSNAVGLSIEQELSGPASLHILQGHGR